MDIFWLILGLILILVGANALTDGASALARRWGISDLVVGLTVVAFGTSAPELSISIISAIRGSSAMAVGNVVGSNIFNILVIIGVVAVIRPIKVSASIMSNEIPLVILSSVALLAIGCGPELGLHGTRQIARPDGILLLLFFAIFMRYTFSQAHNDTHTDDPAAGDAASRPLMSMPKALLWVAAGLAGLIYGGDRFVAGASGLAKTLGMSDALIGLTIVAAGTSLPELATSVTAAIKGKTGIAIGNVIGSNIFNIFLVLGTTATILPLPFGGVTETDLIVMTAAAILFWLFGWRFGHRIINRYEGATLLILYIAYVTTQVLSL
ncbi:MAG: calcium/sodium antiporter [Muribaculaceae bacterium]|nr:calcium/sodium antiporter [Muribaculaceae bacterium]